MNQRSNNNFPRMINEFVLTDEQMQQYENFKQTYKNMPPRMIYRELTRAKLQVSDEILQDHINNLNHLSQMKGFVEEANRERIETVKNILSAPVPARLKRKVQSESVSTQFCCGGGLLLWFLALAAIWQRPCC